MGFTALEKMKSTTATLFFTFFFFGGCIGVDYLEDPTVGERIEVEPGQVALMPTYSAQLSARYFNAYGVEEQVDITWTSSAASVATVNEDGIVTANQPGQAQVTASFKTAVSEAVNITVVANASSVATVEISSAASSILEVGESLALTATVRNISGEILSGREIQWFSENSSIVVVNGQGVATAVANGLAGVHAKCENVKSNSVEFVIGSSRSGTFVPAGGYNAEGMAALRETDGMLVLEFNDNFKTSFALGTFVYLSNSTSGSATFSSGLELGQISTNGAKTFNVTSLYPDVGLFDYRYVIILCKPARVTFGYADLN